MLRRGSGVDGGGDVDDGGIDFGLSVPMKLMALCQLLTLSVLVVSGNEVNWKSKLICFGTQNSSLVLLWSLGAASSRDIQRLSGWFFDDVGIVKVS